MAPVALCAVAVLALLVAQRRGARLAVAVFKLTASSSFVWAALSWGALHSTYGRLLTTGLALSWLGDALLLSAGRGLGFQLGLGAFLAAHLVYAVAFLQLPLDAASLALGAGGVAVSGGLILRWLVPHLPRALRWPVGAYVGAIGIMVVLASGAAVGSGAPALAAGALGFAVSDVSVARDRFVAPGFLNAAWGLPLYFAAQLVLASTVRALGA